MARKNNGGDPDFDNFDEDTTVEHGRSGDGLDTELPGPQDDELEIDIVDDTPVNDRKRPAAEAIDEPTDEELEQYSEKVQKRIKALTHARHDERRKAEKLEREQAELLNVTRQIKEENKRLRQFATDGTAEYTKMAVTAAEAKVKDAQRKLKEAKEAYDVDAEIAAIEELSDAKAEVLAAKNIRPPALQDPVEDVKTRPSADSPAVDPKTKAWTARNKWFGAAGKEDVTAFALGLHKQLVESGVEPATDEYFERIDARMQAKFPELYAAPKARRDADDEDEDPQPRKSSVVAPATRSAGKRRITLTQSQVEICKKLGLTPQQYAAELMKDGKNG